MPEESNPKHEGLEVIESTWMNKKDVREKVKEQTIQTKKILQKCVTKKQSFVRVINDKRLGTKRRTSCSYRKDY